MIEDGLLLFTGTSNGATGGITAGSYVDSPTTGTQSASNIIDLGIVSGIPGFAAGAGARDLGVGDKPALKLNATVTTTFTGGTSLQLQLLGAPDNGSGSPGTYTVMVTSVAVVEASLIAGTQLFLIDLPRPVPGQPIPRFLKLNFVTVGTHTAGATQANIVIDRDDQIIGTAGAYSGYPSGITVAN